MGNLNNPKPVKRLSRCLDRLLAGTRRPDEGFTTTGRTYAELYQTAALIHRILKRPQPTPRPVCLASDDKCLAASAMLAALGAGAPLILPHALSQPVLAEMQAQTGYLRAIVDQKRPMPDRVEQILPPLPSRDLAWTIQDNRRDVDTPYAYLFTGGSTGRPQIWSKTITNLMGEALNLAQTFDITAEDRILATVPPNHIYGLLFSVLLALVSGAQLVEETPVFPREIITALAAHQATILISVPVHYLALQDHRLSQHRPRLAFSSAGMLDANTGATFSHNTGVPIVEVYGSTETGGIATRCRAWGENAFRPFAVVDWKIIGGLLAVNSSFLSSELKREAEGFFICGDRVRALETGEFELLGRSDGIIKVGGKRVDLEQIRETLTRQPGVRDAVVVPLQVGKGHESTIAVLVAGETTVNLLKTGLQAQLEPHARPRIIRIVKELPLTPAGKYDRGAIRDLLA